MHPISWPGPSPASSTASSSPLHESGCRLIFTHVFDDRARAAQTAAGWDTYLSRLGPLLAGGYLSEEEAHEPWEEVHERYAERFGIDPTPDGASWRRSVPLDDDRRYL